MNSFPEFVDLIFPEFVNEGWHDNTAMHWDMAGENGFQMGEMGVNMSRRVSMKMKI